MSPRREAKLLALGLWLLGSLALAQEAVPPLSISAPALKPAPAPPAMGPRTPEPAPQPPPSAPSRPANPPSPSPMPSTLPTYLDPNHVAAYQPPPPPGGPAGSRQGEERTDIQIQLEPPDPIRLFGHLDSEEGLRKRLVEEARERQPMERITFPETPVIAKEPYQGRAWPHKYRFVEPNYVAYNRLLFQQINAERYGWDLGAIHPLISAGVFFADVVTLPYHRFTDPCRWYDASAGYCLPGDPVPLLLYPPELSITGAFAEAATIVALVAIFP